MSNDKSINVTNRLLKEFAEINMKIDAVGCRFLFYQPKVPQKILDRYKK